MSNFKTTPPPPPAGNNTAPRGRGRGRGRGGKSSKGSKKTVCRSSNKKPKSVSTVGKRSQTLESARKERFGVGNKVDVEKY